MKEESSTGPDKAAARTSTDPSPSSAPAVFATTHWSVVVEAGQSDSPKASEAMAQLCRAYWYPLYAYVRRKGYSAADAQDLVQEFFARLLARNYVGSADRHKGKFRSFLLGAFEHFLAKEWRRGQADKRGGGQAIFSLDEMDAEGRYRLEATHELTPAKMFDRRWATALLEQAMTRLEGECRAENKGVLFEKVKELLSGDSASCSYAQLAASLDTTEGALKVSMHRLRRRYGELLRAESVKLRAPVAAHGILMTGHYRLLPRWLRPSRGRSITRINAASCIAT